MLPGVHQACTLIAAAAMQLACAVQPPKQRVLALSMQACEPYPRYTEPLTSTLGYTYRGVECSYCRKCPGNLQRGRVTGKYFAC